MRMRARRGGTRCCSRRESVYIGARRQRFHASSLSAIMSAYDLYLAVMDRTVVQWKADCYTGLLNGVQCMGPELLITYSQK